ncbi:hypothetical protein Q5752_004655 [Cryptotrichosporon argae]
MSTSPKPDLIAQLRALGITERTAKFALSRQGNNLDRAAEYVFSGQADKDEVSDSPRRPSVNLPILHEGVEVSSASSLAVPLSRTTSIAPSVVSADERAAGSPSGSGSAPGSPAQTSKWRSSLSRIRKKSASVSNSLAPRRRSASSDNDDAGDSAIDLGPPALLLDGVDGGQGANEPMLTQDTTPPAETAHTPPGDQSSNLILAALDRQPGRSSSSPSSTPLKATGGALAALGLRAAAVANPLNPVSPPRTAPAMPAPIPPVAVDKPGASRHFLQPSRPVGGSSGSSSGAGLSAGEGTGARRLPRSPSPFFRARQSREKDRERKRDTSPEVGALKKDTGESDAESDGAGVRKYRPAVSAYETDDDGGATSEGEAESEADDESEADTDDDALADGDFFDEETEKNTEANAFFYEGDGSGLGGRAAEGEAKDTDSANFDVYGEEIEQDLLGEGPNVVVPPEPMFAVPSHQQPIRRKSVMSGLELATSRPVYARDRCTITLTHGDPDGALERSGKRMRRYVVLSDLSEESRYAIEWAIGTVARDGDEVFLISVMEAEDKVDPKEWNNKDKQRKVLVQKERQTTALLLAKQVTGLLQRTRLNITVTCQALHAKNARHMLLDLIDFLEPTMAIVGSRGLGKLKGILLGSTSHYLVQKSSVPVMVARRRLKRPLRKTNPANLRHSPRVSLAAASIEKSASSKQEDEIVDIADDEGGEGEPAPAAAPIT